jgi:hypothetical protein
VVVVGIVVVLYGREESWKVLFGSPDLGPVEFATLQTSMDGARIISDSNGGNVSTTECHTPTGKQQNSPALIVCRSPSTSTTIDPLRIMKHSSLSV